MSSVVKITSIQYTGDTQLSVIVEMDESIKEYVFDITFTDAGPLLHLKDVAALFMAKPWLARPLTRFLLNYLVDEAVTLPFMVGPIDR